MMLSRHSRNRMMLMATTILMAGMVDSAMADPPNDECADATYIVGEGTFVFDTSDATMDGPSHAACTFGDESDIDNDVWYCWIATHDATVAVETCLGTTVDTKLAVYDGCACPPSDANLLGCSDDECVYQSRATFDAIAGGQYLIRIGVHPGLGGGAGTFTITSDLSPELPCAQSEANCQDGDRWNAHNSNGLDYIVADDFTPQYGGLIRNLCWRGAYFDGASDCWSAGSDAFEVRYYVDDDGMPGPLYAGPYRQLDGTLIVEGPIWTGSLVADLVREYEYTAEHQKVLSLPGQCYWVEVINTATDACAWFWESGSSGNGRAAQAGDGEIPPEFGEWAPIADDLAVCVDILQGDSSVCELPPANDDCANAILLADGELLAFDTSLATTDGADEPDCDFSLDDTGVNRDVWFEYIVPPSCPGMVTFSLCDSQYDTKVAVYQGADCADLGAAIACDDDGCTGDGPFGSSVTFPAQPGEHYMIRVGGFEGSAGAGAIMVQLEHLDCNENGIPDGCDVQDGTSEDCNGNLVPDECDVADPFYFVAESGQLSPIGYGAEQVFTLADPPEAETAVILTFTARADLSGYYEDETITIVINDIVLGEIFGDAEEDCPDWPAVDVLEVSTLTYNQLAPPGEVRIEMLPSEDVDPYQCTPPSFITVRIEYMRAGAHADCNGNGVPDECEGWAMDCNYNGVPDICERGGLEDCNENGGSDLCDIAYGLSEDCNANGVPDECDSGDANGDGDVDLDDFAYWGACVTGPQPVPNLGCCVVLDFDADSDVDQADFAAFQRAFTGP